MHKLLAVPLAAVAGVLALPALAGAQTLTTEVLSGTANPTLGLGAVEIDCQPAGTSTVSFTVEGEALGPYPGTFVESGTFTITGGTVGSFEATFTITSGTTEITGTKTLRSSSSAVCTPDPEPGITQFADVLVETSYEATITTPSGSSTDHGRATSAVQMLETPTAASAAMQESFVSEGLAHTPGRVVGAGIFADGSHGWAVFAVAAKSDGTTAQAKCTVLVQGVFVKCLTATLLNRTATHVTVIGQALVNGVPTGYRLDLDDLDHPGHGDDVFEIQTASGFHAAGTLAAGSIEIFD
jgi:hypothetical protein